MPALLVIVEFVIWLAFRSTDTAAKLVPVIVRPLASNVPKSSIPTSPFLIVIFCRVAETPSRTSQTANVPPPSTIVGAVESPTTIRSSLISRSAPVT